VQAVVAAVTTATQKSIPPVDTPTVVDGAAHGAVPVQPTVQPTPDQTVNIAAEELANNAKKKKTESCFRCKQPGHYIGDCTVPMCDICESVNHISTACHLLHAPKPTVAMYGYANEALMFFETPLRGTYRPKIENAKLAKLTIQGNAMAISEIVEQLKWIVPSEQFSMGSYSFSQ
jgi:hypothetical protein